MRTRLEPGTIIRITKADDQGGYWTVKRYLDAEWNGEAFLGCWYDFKYPEPGTERWVWEPEELLEAIEELHNRPGHPEPHYLSNITGMVEQLAAEGALR